VARERDLGIAGEAPAVEAPAVQAPAVEVQKAKKKGAR